jgi:isochorismate synthase
MQTNQYDITSSLMNLFEKAHHHFNHKLPFVLFNKPNSTKIVGVFQRNNQLFAIHDFKENGFAMVSFDGSQKFMLPLHESDVIVETIFDSSFYFQNDFPLDNDKNVKVNFENLVQKAVLAIDASIFQKVVVSRKEMVEIHSDIITIFQKLLFQYKAAFDYCFYHPQIGLWMGATPEQFIKIEDTLLKTVALAGTQLYKPDLIWEHKEREEQQLVTDFIVENIQLFSEQITVSQPQNAQAGNLAHIKTEISAVIDKGLLYSIIHEMHPTPAVCGLPKIPAMSFIVENEGYNREFYTGFLGELNVDFTTFRTENSDLFVNLRCMKVEDKQATVFVGCGITKDSNPEKEFLETVNKSITIKSIL